MYNLYNSLLKIYIDVGKFELNIYLTRANININNKNNNNNISEVRK